MTTTQPLYELDWNRAVHVSGEIDATLVRRLAPEILRLRQASDAPITVAIDSGGGSLGWLSDLQSLLRGPDQRGRTCPIYTVALSHAESAAALLLASGDYAVAQPNASILFHDIFVDERRVTGERAAELSRELILDSHAQAQALGESMLRRSLWVYAGKRDGSGFAEERARFPEWTAGCDASFAEIAAFVGLPQPGQYDLDIAGYVIMLFNRLSSPVDKVVASAPGGLVGLFQSEAIVGTLAAPGAFRQYLAAGYEHAKSLLGARAARALDNDDFCKYKARGIERVIAAILLRQAHPDSFSISDRGLACIERDYLQLRDFALEENAGAVDALVGKPETCLPEAAREGLREGTPEEVASIRARFVRPQAIVFWRLLGIVGRRLLFGENQLTAGDAQLLGLVDEVLGGSDVASAGEVARGRCNGNEAEAGRPARLATRAQAVGSWLPPGVKLE